MTKPTDELWTELDALGEDEVRRRLLNGVWGPDNATRVQAWLRQREAERPEAVQRETLRLAREANEHAAEAKRIAVRANWIALFAVLVALVALVHC